MTKLNEIERQAGTLMLSNLKMFNEAAVVFEKHIEPAFWKGFDLYTERFKEENSWSGKTGMTQKEYLWLAPPHWAINAETNTYKYWFENHLTTSEGRDYYLAVLTQSHTEQGAFGFQFKLNPSWFGGTRKMHDYLNNTAQKHRTSLVTLGFKDQRKGNFFLPIKLDINQVVDCWKEYGEFPVEHEVFTPLQQALEKLIKSAAIFDEFFSSFDAESE